MSYVGESAVQLLDFFLHLISTPSAAVATQDRVAASPTKVDTVTDELVTISEGNIIGLSSVYLTMMPRGLYIIKKVKTEKYLMDGLNNWNLRETIV